MNGVFADIGIMIIGAALLGFLAKMFKQPLIPAYILAGLIFGPTGLQFVTDKEIIFMLGEIGVAFMLFVVGLELELSKLKSMGKFVLVGGTIQCGMLMLLGFLFARFLQFPMIESLYLAFILAFSSTLVVLKLLSDRKETETIHARIVIGFLLLQDLVAILGLVLFDNLSSLDFAVFSSSLVGIFIMFGVALFLGKFIFPFLFKFAAKNQEVLFTLSLTVCFIFSMMAQYFNYSIVIGAFIAGVTLANLSYNVEILSRIKPLRDFFSILFFVSLGMELIVGTIGDSIMLCMILLGFTIIVKPFITAMVTIFSGYAPKTSFLSAIYMAQISEFSLILAAHGLFLGHISASLFSSIILLGIISITLSTYMVSFNRFLYKEVKPLLHALQRTNHINEETIKHFKYNVLLIGLNRTGHNIIKTLHKMGKSVLVIDYNPDTIRQLEREGTPCMYGDINDVEVLDRVHLEQVGLCISTIVDPAASKLLLQQMQKRSKKAVSFVTAMNVSEALELYDQGADYVILPHLLGGHHVSMMIEDGRRDITKILKEKLSHIKELQDHASHRRGI